MQCTESHTQYGLATHAERFPSSSPAPLARRVQPARVYGAIPRATSVTCVRPEQRPAAGSSPRPRPRPGPAPGREAPSRLSSAAAGAALRLCGRRGKLARPPGGGAGAGSGALSRRRLLCRARGGSGSVTPPRAARPGRGGGSSAGRPVPVTAVRALLLGGLWVEGAQLHFT